jgi:hypothetical protein
MKVWTIILTFLLYAFYDFPIEITDIFLAYLIPFIISIVCLAILILNFRFISSLTKNHKRIAKILNWLTIVVFSIMTVWNFPIPVDRGYRNKNWTDIDMLINPKDLTDQYVSQHIEFDGSNMPGQNVKVKKINSWLRWRHLTETKNLNGQWLYIDNSNNGYNSPPFNLDETKIDYDKDKQKVKLVTIVNGKLQNNAR